MIYLLLRLSSWDYVILFKAACIRVVFCVHVSGNLPLSSPVSCLWTEMSRGPKITLSLSWWYGSMLYHAVHRSIGRVCMSMCKRERRCECNPVFVPVIEAFHSPTKTSDQQLTEHNICVHHLFQLDFNLLCGCGSLCVCVCVFVICVSALDNKMLVYGSVFVSCKITYLVWWSYCNSSINMLIWWVNVCALRRDIV